MKFGCQLEKINYLHSWVHETDPELWSCIWDPGLCQETGSTDETGQPPCIYLATGKMMDPICSLQSFIFAGCGAAKGMDKVVICCFVSNQFIIYNFSFVSTSIIFYYFIISAWFLWVKKFTKCQQNVEFFSLWPQRISELVPLNSCWRIRCCV